MKQRKRVKAQKHAHLQFKYRPGTQHTQHTPTNRNILVYIKANLYILIIFLYIINFEMLISEMLFIKEKAYRTGVKNREK